MPANYLSNSEAILAGKISGFEQMINLHMA